MLTSLISLKIQKKINPDAPSMSGMMLTMPFVSLFIGFSVSCAAGFYWACSSLIAGAIQSIIQIYYGPNKIIASEQSKDLIKRNKEEKAIKSEAENAISIGFKKARLGYIVKLKIPGDAKRSSATGRKCRCSKAVVLSITNAKGEEDGTTEVRSCHDSNFIYKVGETVEVKDFCDDRFDECAPGIHFFITRKEAEDYDL